MLGWIVGSPLNRLAVFVLVVGLLSIGAIQYIRWDERDKVNQQRLEDQVETRKRVDDAVRNSPDAVGDALDFLLDRQSRD